MNRNRLDILPYYARLVAILNQYYKDIGPVLVQKLEKALSLSLRFNGSLNVPFLLMIRELIGV